MAVVGEMVAPGPVRRDAGGERRAPLRVGVLVDLVLRPDAGGHVKCWERLAEAAVGLDDQLDLTVHFEGPAPRRIELSRSVRYQLLPAAFSTARLVNGIVDHTDIGRWHRGLASHLGGYDVIHTTDAFFCYARTAARFSRAHGVPLVSSIHTNIPDYARLTVRKLFERAVGRRAARRLAPLGQAAAALIGGHLERRLKRHLAAATLTIGGYGEAGLRRGIDRRRFHPGRRDRDWLSRRFAVPAHQLVAIYAGTLNAAKNVRLLVPALHRARAGGVPLQLLCVGSGPEAGELGRAFGEAARLPGALPQDELARAYAAADLFLFPSTIDEAGNAALEAMASGLPCLLAAGSGVARRMGDCPGVRVLPGDRPEAWAAAIAELAAQPDRRAAMGRAARAAIEARVPDWRSVLLEDLLPVWRQAAGAAWR